MREQALKDIEADEKAIQEEKEFVRKLEMLVGEKKVWIETREACLQRMKKIWIK